MNSFIRSLSCFVFWESAGISLMRKNDRERKTSQQRAEERMLGRLVVKTMMAVSVLKSSFKMTVTRIAEDGEKLESSFSAEDIQ